VTSQSGCVETGAAVSRSNVMIENVSDEPLTLPKPTFIGLPEPVSEARVNLVKSGGQSGAESPKVPRRKRRNLRLLSNLNNTLETRLWYFRQILPRLDNRRDVLDLDGNVLKTLLSVVTGVDLHPPTIHPNHLDPNGNCKIQESNPRSPGQ